MTIELDTNELNKPKSKLEEILDKPKSEIFGFIELQLIDLNKKFEEANGYIEDIRQQERETINRVVGYGAIRAAGFAHDPSFIDRMVGREIYAERIEDEKKLKYAIEDRISFYEEIKKEYLQENPDKSKIEQLFKKLGF